MFGRRHFIPLLVKMLPLLVGSVWLFGCNSDSNPVNTTTATGTIVVNPEPDSLSAPWTLTGPDSFTQSGTGDMTLANMAVGNYSVLWQDVTGMNTPAVATQALADGVTITFSGVYTEIPLGTGTIIVDPQPDSLAAPWGLDGPGGFYQSGSGDMTLANMTVGEYTVTWNGVRGWNTPSSTSATLLEDDTITFTATYTEIPPATGTVVINSFPGSLDAPWDLSGPGSYVQSGVGDQILLGLAAGDYTISWGVVDHWISPDPITVTSTLIGGETLTLSGTYHLNDNFVFINAGTFTMGSPADELGRGDDETQHTVTLSQGFYMSPIAVTEQAWDSVMGAGTSTSPKPQGGKNWYDAVAYCNALSAIWGLPPAYTITGTIVTWNREAGGYRLPTESEWEYACRAGSTTAFANGPITATGCSLDPNLDAIGWYCYNCGLTRPDVAQKSANSWGLYDMHGSVWEWCWDGYGDYPVGPVTDPEGAMSGSQRVVRGGNYSDAASSCRSAVRDRIYPEGDDAGIGFRVVRSAP